MTPKGASGPGRFARLTALIGSAFASLAGNASDQIIEKPNAIEPQPQDLEFQKYVSDRTHELELNKFSHTFELERLKLLLILNGGAFGVAAGFSTAVTQSEGPSRWLAIAAIVSWIAGLAVAARATQLALDLQVAFARAYHNRRRAIEWRLLAGRYPNFDERQRVLSLPTRPKAKKRRLIKRIVKPWRGITVGLVVWRNQSRTETARAEKAEAAAGKLTVDTVDLEYNRIAETRRKEGERLSPKVKHWAMASVLLFVAGAVLMVSAIATAVPEESRAKATFSLRVSQAD